MFESAVRQRLIDQGYEVKETYRRYDGEGSDMDMVVSPPPSRHGPFLPAEIAVQVKWKQGIDQADAWAVAQIKRWAEWQGSTATKYVISSASGFTEGGTGGSGSERRGVDWWIADNVLFARAG